jgi:hypothetical protein
MNRWVGVGVVIALLLIGFVAYTRPEMFPARFDTPRLIYLLMALLLVSGAAYGFRRLQTDRRTVFTSAVVWLALIAVIALVYVWTK